MESTDTLDQQSQDAQEPVAEAAFNVLVTGTSTGIGEATALHLAQQGMLVFAGVRDEADAQKLVAESAGVIHPVFLDVTDTATIASAVAAIAEAVGGEGLQGLVNNAGEAYPGPLELLGLDSLRRQLEVNVIGQIAVTQAALPLIRQGTGRIVFVGSVGGHAAFEFAGAYHASKYAMEAVADSLRQELEPESVYVSLVEPGPVSTPLWRKGVERVDSLLSSASPRVDHYRERLNTFRETLIVGDRHAGSPQDVAVVIATALTADKPSSRYAVGLTAKITATLRPWVPDRVLDVVSRRVLG